ncbi:MAG: hypothetical protein AAGD13_09075 [Pseudomonadota bacterium]
MSEQDESEFLRSLERVRKAHYSRDPKRRAIEAIEKQMSQENTVSVPDDLASQDTVCG